MVHYLFSHISGSMEKVFQVPIQIFKVEAGIGPEGAHCLIHSGRCPSIWTFIEVDLTPMNVCVCVCIDVGVAKNPLVKGEWKLHQLVFYQLLTKP